MRRGLTLLLLALATVPLQAADFNSTWHWNAQARVRGEIRQNVFDFDDSRRAPTDDTWLLTRFRFGLDWTPTPWLRLTVQVQDAREEFSRRPDVPLQNGAEGDDTLDLRLATMELGDPQRLSLKLGRQVLSYGDERLVGPLEWLNFGRVFDAARLHLQHSDWWLDAFTSSVVGVEKADFNRSDWLRKGDGRDEFFSGLYFSTQRLAFQVTDLYLFHLREKLPAGDSNFATFGLRMKGDPARLAGWDYTVELVGQLGEVADRPFRAYAHHLEAGYNWLHTPWKPRLALEYSYGSGDRDAGDGRVTTFQNLFPTNHPPYGLMDTWAWQNLHNLVLRTAFHPAPNVRATVDFHAFWLATTGDAWYRVNGVTRVRPITPGADPHAGCELDLTLAARINPHTDLLLGWSHFFAGQYLADTGADTGADFGYAMLTVNF